MRTILVPVDFSEGALAALQAAEHLATRFGAEILVLHVAPPAARQAMPDGPVDPATAELVLDAGLLGKGMLIANVQEQMQLFLQKIPATAPRRVVYRAGLPAATIVQAAQDLGAGLVVMGTHGRRGLARLVLGSTAEEVVRKSPLPVLTIKPEATLDLAVQPAPRPAP